MEYILITGITGAIGSSVASYLSEAGYPIIGLGRKELDIQPVFCNEYYAIPEFNEINAQKFFEHLKHKNYFIKVTIFLNGGFSMDTVQDFKLENFNNLLQQNYLSTLSITKYILQYYQLQNQGKFIFTSAATTNHAELFPTAFSYTATKTLINHLAQTIHAGESKNNIEVAVLKPGIINTPINQKFMPNEDFSKWVQPATIAEKIKDFIETENKELVELLF